MDSPKHKVSTEENMYSDVFNLVDKFDLKCDLISDISSDLQGRRNGFAIWGALRRANFFLYYTYI